MGYSQEKREEKAYELAEAILKESAARNTAHRYLSNKDVPLPTGPVQAELSAELCQRIKDNESAPLVLPASELRLDNFTPEALKDWGITRKNWGIFKRKTVNIMDEDLISAMKRVAIKIDENKPLINIIIRRRGGEVDNELNHPDSISSQPASNITRFFTSKVKDGKNP